ncbi:MAG: hypothetical protein NTU79_04300 [Planctomycetota bacterium]|nr:hypothetical protein [Planctomycetota bacterium]
MIKLPIRNWFFFAMLVAISIMSLEKILRFDSLGAGKHEWLTEGPNQGIDFMFAELGRNKWFDLTPKDFSEFVHQVNTIIPTRLESGVVYDSEFDDRVRSFPEAFLRIDRLQSIDRGLLMLLSALELDVAAQDGVLVIGPAFSGHLNMTRMYDLPDVNSEELIESIQRCIEPGHWQSAGGASHLEILHNDFRTQSKLVVFAPRRTHCKIESMIAVLAKRYGWKRFEFPSWLPKQTAKTPTPVPMNGYVCGGVM